MKKTNFWLKVTRLNQVLIGGIATWVVTLISDGSNLINTQKFFACLVVSLGILGASIWHYGARSDIYAKKKKHQVIIENPFLLLIIGGSIFILLTLLTWSFLSYLSLIVVIINIAIILFYAKFLDRFWLSKNITVAINCTAPVLIGLLAINSIPRVAPFLILTTFLFYISREILKDIVDLEADKGQRYALAISIGETNTLRVSGLILFLSIISVLTSLKYINENFLALFFLGFGVIWLFYFSFKLLLGKNIASKFLWMDLGIISIIISFLISNF